MLYNSSWIWFHFKKDKPSHFRLDTKITILREDLAVWGQETCSIRTGHLTGFNHKIGTHQRLSEQSCTKIDFAFSFKLVKLTSLYFHYVQKCRNNTYIKPTKMRALSVLSKNNSIVIKRADKDSAIVILNRNH